MFDWSGEEPLDTVALIFLRDQDQEASNAQQAPDVAGAAIPSARVAFGEPRLWNYNITSRISSCLSALFLLVSTAGAYCPPTETPPPAFNHPYAGKLVEYELPNDEVAVACNRLKAGGARAAGCGFEVIEHDPRNIRRVAHRYGLIIYPEGCKAIRRHEIGHVNGWAHHH